MPLADPRRRRNPVATALRDAVVVLAVLAIGTTVQVSFERLPPSHGDGSRLSSAPAAPSARPAEVDIDRLDLDPEDVAPPTGTGRVRHRSAIHAERAERSAGPAADRGVNVEIPAIATGSWSLRAVERP